MAQRNAAKKKTKKSSSVFSAEERAAMKELVKERKAGAARADGEKALLDAVAAMKGLDRTLGQRIHEIVKAAAPDLSPKTWYGMPAYANQDGKVVCFFKPGLKFKSRYATLGFEDAADLDEGAMWPTSYALTRLTPADEKKITALVKKAAGV